MKIFQKISFFFQATLLLVGTTGITVEKFYCGSFLRSTHVFSSPVPCCSKTNQSNGKCHTEKEYFQADLNGNLIVLDLKIENPTISYSIFNQFYYLLPTHFKVNSLKYLHFNPPKPLKDILVLTQSFLI